MSLLAGFQALADAYNKFDVKGVRFPSFKEELAVTLCCAYKAGMAEKRRLNDVVEEGTVALHNTKGNSFAERPCLESIESSVE